MAPKSTKKSEKRQFRWRSKCPQKVQERLVRATTQEFVVLKQNGPVNGVGSAAPPPKCCFVVAGETGNAYTVKIGHVPSCTCPDYMKRSDHCKHTMFILNKIIGLDVNDELMYQKAYLTDELKSMFELMDENRYDAVEYYFQGTSDGPSSSSCSSSSINDTDDVDGLIDQFGTVQLEQRGKFAYTNVREITGQNETRDRSTYRPFHWEQPPYIRYN